MPGKKIWISTDRSLETQCRQIWELKTPSEFYHRRWLSVWFTSRSSSNFSQQNQKSPPLLLAGRGEKEIFWSKSEHSVLLNKNCPQEKLVNQGLTYWGIFRIWVREGRYPTPTSTSHPLLPGRGGIQKASNSGIISNPFWERSPSFVSVFNPANPGWILRDPHLFFLGQNSEVSMVTCLLPFQQSWVWCWYHVVPMGILMYSLWKLVPSSAGDPEAPSEMVLSSSVGRDSQKDVADPWTRPRHFQAPYLPLRV